MAYKVLLFCLFVFAAEAVPKLGSKSCTWGPSYWCQNYHQAKGCNAVEHCRQKVWPQQVKNGCDNCKQVIDKLELLLQNKTIDDEIIKFLEQVCDEVAGPLAGPCKAAVDADAPKIIASLAGLLGDSYTVCAALGLCSTKDVLSAKPMPVFMPGPVLESKKPVKPVKAGPECALCEYVMSELDSILAENATQEEIKEALDQVCNLLPSSISSECTAFVNEYEPEIIQLLLSFKPAEICAELGLCTGTKAIVKKQQLKSTTCDICKLAIGYLVQELSQNATEAEIKTELDALCAKLPSSISTECTALVDEYADAIISLIIQELNPDQICQELGLCNAGAKCHLGPSYWCKSKQTAISCKAVHHCSTFVWKN